jgi:negative regulator of PHO system
VHVSFFTSVYVHELMGSMAEMITGYPLFRGRDNADQLVQIMKIVGTPSNETLAQIKHDSVYSFTSLIWRSTDK